MKDYAHGVPVNIRPAKTGEWRARCPECRVAVLRGTHFGTMAALQAHLDEQHFVPVRGNA